MRRLLWFGFVTITCATLLGAAEKNCVGLSESTPLLTVHSELIESASFTPDGGKTIRDLPFFCRVSLLLSPSKDSKIQVELWLPKENWNGRLQGIGNGGFGGSISYDSLAEAVRQHYVAVATDTGHEGRAEDASWALNHPEKIVDFGYRSIHLMTLEAKRLIEKFYGSGVQHAYFSSCSDGGREALMEAQRYPRDYDGIIAGAPANYWTHLVSNSAANAQAFVATASSYIPSSKLPAIQAASLKACNMPEGAAYSIVEDSSRCHPSTSQLLCKGAETEACLNADQLTALNKLYAGGHLSDGTLIFPGYAPGGEAVKGSWDVWITGPAVGQSLMFAFSTTFFRNMVYHNPTWSIRDFKPDVDVKAADEKLGSILNAMDVDLNPFLARGGKLILYHGWEDAAISPFNTISYFDAVQKKMGVPTTKAGVRLFMVPGMEHCSGGNGAYNFGQFGAGSGEPTYDVDAALVKWVEHKAAPEQVIASKPGTAMTHLLCAYPLIAHYRGQGDGASASSYTCAP